MNCHGINLQTAPGGRISKPSLRATESRERAPDDRLRDAIHSRVKKEWIAHMGMMCVNKPVSLFLRSKVRAFFDDLVCLPDQTHIRSSREATAPGFRLRRVGSRGRDHSSLRHLKPSNPSVRPPGSAATDRASADWFC